MPGSLRISDAVEDARAGIGIKNPLDGAWRNMERVGVARGPESDLAKP